MRWSRIMAYRACGQPYETTKGRRLFDMLRAGDTLVVRWVDRLGETMPT